MGEHVSYVDDGRFELVRDGAGTVTLRATSMDLGVVRSLADGALVVAGLDAAGSADVRQRRAGIDALALVLKESRG